MNPTLHPDAAAVITVSDRCFAGTREDLSGPAVARVLIEAGATNTDITIVPDELDQIATAILEASARGCTLIVTTGGTGLAPRDVTPEATLSVCTRLVPGLSELIRTEGSKHTPFAALSRGVCGALSTSLVINLPGNPAGAETSLHAVLPLLPHALNLLAGNTSHDPPAK
jgi:molybdopterin adenylyltransferase